ncbi:MULTISPECIES: hypothetical protein [unclassified Nonomuraea]|uniref:hypothetical protein n=1 Tax=unclassified Nonomuraea TaxID=2593643 RepID=UPI0033DFD2FF
MSLEAWAAVAAAAIAAVALYFSATAAIAAKRSAREAAAIAKVEVERREEERERRHDELAPLLPGEIETYIATEHGWVGPGNARRYLWGILTLSRDYTIAIQTAGDWLGPREVYDVEAGTPRRVKLYPLGPGITNHTEVQIRFWPPRAPHSSGPPTTPTWQCYCRRPERPPDRDDGRIRKRPFVFVGRGHWEKYVRLALPPELHSEHKPAPAD